MPVMSPQDPLRSRSFASSTSSRSTTAQQLLALGGIASDGDLGRLGSDAGRWAVSQNPKRMSVSTCAVLQRAPVPALKELSQLLGSP
jgi:hypothetical protein